MSSGLLQAFDDGIDRNLEPGEPEADNVYTLVETGKKEVKTVPLSLGEALDMFEADDVIKAALPGDMYRVFMHYKRDEWEKYLATVTQWDLEEYLNCLP